MIITGLNTGGAEVMLLKLLERLDKRFSPHVISLSDVGAIGLRIEALGIPVESLGMRRGVLHPGLFFRLVGRLKELKPDLVHTWMYHADLLGGLAGRMAGVPAVAWGIRCSNLDRDKTKLSTLAVVGMCAKLSRWVPDRILSCSTVAQQPHIGRGYASEKWVVVPNGFDLTLFHPDPASRTSVRLELKIEDDAPLVGLIGRYDPFKNHAGFLKAAGILHEALPDVHFLLAGKGVDVENGELMHMIKSAGLQRTTHLLGLRNDVPRLMAALDLFASSSYGEAFPNVLGEAMASGVPCAVTDVGDSAYIVGDAGRVVPAGDMVGLAAALEAILSLPLSERVALRNRARARVAERFEIGTVVRQYETIYDGLSRKRAAEIAGNH